ncbi:MAG: Crp/Fnr family transcriptional regulator [Vicinamibacterales bacterium]|nr:Crp/Fnr family transcriptional regulator [Vicinamibacterales bacterium]
MSANIDASLRLIPLFRRLSPDDRTRVAAVSRVHAYARGDVLFSEGEVPDRFCVVAEGRVKVFKMTHAGKDVILEIFGAGDPLGAVAVYEGHPYPASAVALADTTCIEIPRGAFFALLEQHPSLVRGLLAGLTMRLVELTNRVADLTGGRVEPRVARLFLKMAHEHGRADRGGIFIPVALSRQELADLTGTTIETCIRIMSRWSKDGVVRTDKDGFVVFDKDELDAVSQG